MLLAVDAGNTHITFGLYRRSAWTTTWRVPTHSPDGPALWQAHLDRALRNLKAELFLKEVVISSVVPQLNEPLRAAFAPHASCLFVEPSIYPQLNISISNPRETGTDLIANAVAAYERFGQACLVIDFGTALTYTTLDDRGKIIGVAIAPGLRTALKALSLHAAQLPEVPLALPESALGTNTVEAIQAGLVLGYADMVAGMIERIRSEVGSRMKVVATGGLSHVLHPLHERVDAVDSRLTLEGLRLIAAQVHGLDTS